MRLAVVEWTDSVGSVGKSTWCEIKQLKESTIPTIHTVGWVISDTKDHLHLVSGHCGGYAPQDFMIPKGCITKVRYVDKRYDIPDPAAVG